MKKTQYLLLYLACILSLSVSAHTPDDVGHRQMIQYLKLLPDTLYFNQDYSFDLPSMQGHSFTVSITDYPLVQRDNNIRILVPYSNRDEDTKTIQIYAGGNNETNLIGEKPVTILQKLKGNVAGDNNLFKIDDKVIDLRDNMQPEQFRAFKTFDINAERFQAKGLQVSGFTLRVPETNEQINNQGNTVTEATRTFISRLKIGDNVRIENIKCSYLQYGRPVTIDINYTPSVTLAPNM